MGPALTIEEEKLLIPAEDLKALRSAKETPLKVEREVKADENPLVEIEVAIRKVERLGGFKD